MSIETALISYQIALVIGFVLSAVVSYLLASVNTAIIVVRLRYGKDIRTFGSGNAGFTNVMRSFGKGPAIVTMAGDLLKAAVAIGASHFIFWLLTNSVNSELSWLLQTNIIAFYAAIFAILGHSFPIFYGFKGGKGIAVAAASMLVINPLHGALLIGLFLVIFFLFKMVSLGSIIAAAGIPVATYIELRMYNDMNIAVETALAAVMAILLIVMHRQNIQRIIKGTEHKFVSKKKEG